MYSEERKQIDDDDNGNSNNNDDSNNNISQCPFHKYNLLKLMTSEGKLFNVVAVCCVVSAVIS